MVLFRFTFAAMASPNEVQIGSADERDARRAANAAIAEVRRIEAKYSRYRDDSVTTRINRSAGGDAVAIDPETAALLHYADRCHTLSGGRFDLTSGVLRHVWKFHANPPRLPDENSLASARALVAWEQVEWDDHAFRLPRAGMEIDFGGVGKEYAADRAATICLEQGVAHGFVNLGGDVRVVGPQPDGAPWRIGIRHPRPSRTGADEAIAGIELTQGAVATSGDYERYFDLDGERYCHLLDARTGRPVRHWQSVSVVAPMCIVAGSCATIAMLLEGGAASFLDAQQVGYLAIARDGTVHGTAAVPLPRPP
jgi:FAD:protein FMN transferase